MKKDRMQVPFLKTTDKSITEGPLAYLLIASIVGNICWVLGLAYPVFMLVTESGKVRGVFSGLVMLIMIIAAVFILAIIAVHIISLIAAIKMREGDLDKIKMYNVGSVAWLVICAWYSYNEPEYAWASVLAGLTTLGFLIAFQKLVKLEKEKNKTEEL